MKSKSNTEPKKCHCGKTALYRVFRVGYCKDHYAEGVADQARVLAKQKAFAIVNRVKAK
jgi:hypothetical protein